MMQDSCVLVEIRGPTTCFWEDSTLARSVRAVFLFYHYESIDFTYGTLFKSKFASHHHFHLDLSRSQALRLHFEALLESSLGLSLSQS